MIIYLKTQDLVVLTEPSRQSLELAGSSIRETYQVPRGNGMMAERMSTDIAALKNQYMSIRSRQLRAHLVYTKPGMLLGDCVKA